jgi:hypothetical protein
MAIGIQSIPTLLLLLSSLDICIISVAFVGYRTNEFNGDNFLSRKDEKSTVEFGIVVASVLPIFTK